MTGKEKAAYHSRRALRVFGMTQDLKNRLLSYLQR